MNGNSWLKGLFGWRKVGVALYFVTLVVGLASLLLAYNKILSGDWVQVVYYASLVVISLVGGNAIEHISKIFKKE